MTKIDLYTTAGEKKGAITLNESVFAAKVNPDLMHRAVVLRLANRRNPIAHVLNRGEVSYSTKKMFRQKGTGNARRGARSTNLLRGGGVTHGPTNQRNFTKMMPKKERRQALFSSLTSKVNLKNVLALEGYAGETPKTKDFITLLSKLPEGKKYLFVLPRGEKVFEQSCRNVPGVRTILTPYLNPMDVLWADKVCFFEKTLPELESVFLNLTDK